MKSELIKRTVTALIAGSLFFFILLKMPIWFSSLFFLFICGFILIVEWPAICPSFPWSILATSLYIVIPFFLMILMNINVQQRPYFLFMWLIVFGHDTGAYLFGKFLGRHKLAPSISPKKTWEGFLGGFFIVFLLIFILNLGFKLSYGALLGISALLTILSTTGDLFESWLKRRARLKDSGSILPGHGGLLDRFDSIIFVTPFFYFSILCFLKK